MLRAVDHKSLGSEVLVLTSAAALVPHKESWLALEAASDAPCFFQSYAWSGHVASALERSAAGAYQPLVCMLVVDGTVSAIWPLARQKRAGMWYLTTLDDPFGQITDVLAASDAAAKTLVAKVLAYVQANRLADTLLLDRVRAGTPLEAVLTSAGASLRGEVGAPVVDLTPWPSMAALKSSRNKKTMKNLRNATHRLERAGAYNHQFAVGDHSVEAIIQSTYARRTAWLKARAMTAPQFRSPAHHAVLTGGEVWNMPATRIAFELFSDGKPIAQQWGFLHNGRYYAYMSATDPHAAALSAGRLHLAFVIDEALRLGIRTIEFLTPASDYKMVWTDHARVLRHYGLSLSSKGRIVDALWNRGLRPLAKAAFYALPAVLRKRIVSHDEGSSLDAV